MVEIVFNSKGSVSEFNEQLVALDKKFPTILILSAENEEFLVEDLNPILRSLKANIIGGMFAAVIYDNLSYSQGFILIGINEQIQLNAIKQLSKKDPDQIDEEIELSLKADVSNINTMFIFIDGFTVNNSDAINALFDNYGLSCNYIGGAAGSSRFQSEPVLFTNEGVIADAFIYAYSKQPSAVGVRHGWQSISGPYEITSSKDNVVKEIDYRPAFEVYKEVVDQYSSIPITKDNFFEIAKSYPFGINILSEEKLARTTISLQDSGILCLVKLEEGAYIDILNGEKESLLAAAQKAKQICDEQIEFEPKFQLLVDCISRNLFLQNEYPEELAIIKDKRVPLVGALTYGEIANTGREYLEIYNNTAVVGMLG